MDTPAALRSSVRPPRPAPRLRSTFGLLGACLAWLALGTSALAKPGQATPKLQSQSFDWDDNIMVMPTTITLTHKTTGKKVEVPTGAWAEEHNRVGKSGPYKDYAALQDTYRFFRDAPGQNHFREDLKLALQRGRYQAPRWKAFVKAMSRPESARRTTIITAREHAPETIMAGLELLQREGHIKHLPRLKNLYPVNNPKLNPTGVATPQAKLATMERLLDGLQRGARRFGRPASWTFSDDDHNNINRAQQGLRTQARTRWPDVRIKLVWTGTSQGGATAPRRTTLVHAGRALAPARPSRSR